MHSKLTSDEEVKKLFFTRNAIQGEGSVYLACDRNLSEPICRKMGIATIDDVIFFSFGPLRFKSRSIHDKTQTKFNRLTEEKSEGFVMPFFNQQDFVDKDYIIITEGEFDAVAVACLGYSNVVSLPNGASSVRGSFTKHFEYLNQYKQIYICFDMDEPGEKAVQEAKKIIPSNKFRRIHLPYKDANDLLIEDKEESQEIFDKAFNSAERIQLDGVYLIDDEGVDIVAQEIDSGIASGFPKIDKVLKGFRGGEITVVSADTGVGKTTFCVNLIFNLVQRNHACWVNSYEMNYKVVYRKFWSLLLRTQLKTRELSEEEKQIVKQWHRKEKLIINKDRQRISVETVRKTIEHAVLIHDVKFVMIDHLDYLSSEGKKDKHYENVDDTVRALHDIALDYNIHIFLVVHPKQKDSKVVERSDLKGSAGIKQYADNILLLSRPGEIEKKQNDKRFIIDVQKNRMFGILKQIELFYMDEYDGFVEV